MGPFFPEGLQHPGQQPGTPEQGYPQPQTAYFVTEDHVQFFIELVGFFQDFPGMEDIPFPSLGQFEFFAFPVEKRGPQMFFQIADVDAQGRLGNIQPVRRPGQVSVFRQRTHIPLFFQFHCVSHLVLCLPFVFLMRRIDFLYDSMRAIIQ